MEQSNIALSLVIPLFNEQDSLVELAEGIDEILKKRAIVYELLFIDDGSTDDSWSVIKTLIKRNSLIKGVKFRRNYGKSAGIYTGFRLAIGEVIITMDADLQDSPDELPALYDMIVEQGYDLVSGWKKKRYDPLSKTIPTKLFNAATRMLSGIQLHDFNCGLKAYRRAVVKNIEVYGEMHRYIPLLAKQAGFTRIGEKIVTHRERPYGYSKFGIERFINGFLDLLSVSFVSRFAKRPMHFFGTLGTFIFIIGFVLVACIIGQKFVALYIDNRVAPLVADNPLFYLSILTMIIGTQLFLTGFISELVSRNSAERNEYKIEEEIGINECVSDDFL